MSDLCERLRSERISAPPEHPVHPSICDEAADEIERLQTWTGLMEILDKHYPSGIAFFNETSDDPGAKIIVLTRSLDESRKEIERLRAELKDRDDLADEGRDW